MFQRTRTGKCSRAVAPPLSASNGPLIAISTPYRKTGVLLKSKVKGGRLFLVGVDGVTIHADTREDELRQLDAPKAMPRVIRSAWMDR
jgi:hypothetical protein